MDCHTPTVLAMTTNILRARNDEECDYTEGISC